ncbi:ATP-dependent endonuclease [Arthrobacter sp. JSM 101049]|uniref:ATP-dependent nuclease n=1 Tax=Arthrobacter sp. JSM 101049 TaxID=929097 RepID=UPI001ECE71E5|nr:AAA family ATPase [Micrococcaceae bacterium RIT 802]
MRLKKIKVANHSRLQDFELEVRDHLVLVGSNDVGKSSLLRCLDLLLGSSAAQLYNRLEPDDFRDTELPLQIEATLETFTPLEKAAFPDEIHVEGQGSELKLNLQLEATLDNGENLEIRRIAGNSTGRQLSRDQLVVLGWKSVGALQSASRDFREDRNSVLKEILSAVELGEEAESLGELAEQFQAGLTSSKVLAGIRNDLAVQLSKAVPVPISANELSFVTNARAADDLLAEVQLRVNRDGREHSLAEQSDGARALIALALYDLVSSSANIVAIDEPEIHLHPTSQRSLAKLLKRGDNQKILATHSPDIVGAFAPEDIVVVRKGGQIAQPRIGFLDAEAKLMVHWWVKDKLEPLTSAVVILVEGASDRILVERVAELLNKDLDRLGVSLMEMDGSGDVKYIRALFGPSGFEIPTRVLIDRDAVSKAAPEFGVAAEALEDDGALEAKGVFVSQCDLEDEYVAAVGAERMWQVIEGSSLFSNNERALCVATDQDQQRSNADIAAFCRHKKRKIRSAIMVVDILTVEEASKIASVVRLLESLNKA